MTDKELYTVWVGGREVNDYYVTFDEAHRLANAWRKHGFDDVVVERMESAK